VSPDSGYLVIVVELVQAAGQRLEAHVPYDDEVNPSTGRMVQRRRVTLGLIRAVIERGLDQGWRPQVRGLPPMRIPEVKSLGPASGAPPLKGSG
jgi:hypothetical protein